MSSYFSALTGKMGGWLTNLGHAHTLSAIAGLFTGKTDSNNVPEEIQAMIGLFGLGDEIGFKRALLKMSKEQQAIITAFIDWHFLSHQKYGPLGGVIAWYKLNKWREVVVKLDSPQAKIGEKTVQTVHPPAKKPGPTTTTTDITYDFSEGVEHTQKFLRKLVRVIKEGAVTGKDGDGDDTVDWEPGYRAAVSFCAASGMATVNDSSILKWLDGVLKSIPPFVLATPKKVDDYINRKHAMMINERAAHQGWWARISARLDGWL